MSNNIYALITQVTTRTVEDWLLRKGMLHYEITIHFSTFYRSTSCKIEIKNGDSTYYADYYLPEIISRGLGLTFKQKEVEEKITDLTNIAIMQLEVLIK